MVAHKIASERVGDEFAVFGDTVKRHERSKSRATAFAEQHAIKHGEPIVRDAGTFGCRALGFHVLIARYLSRDIVECGLNRFGAGARGQGGESGGEIFEWLALDCGP